MKIAIVTDAWRPQINGVVTTLTRTYQCLADAGHRVLMESPAAYRSVPCPTYPEIRLALWPGRRLQRRLEQFAPDAIHIATEGPLGIAARHYCLHRRLSFTTSYHTQFPEYVRKRIPVPEAVSYAYLRRYHGAARRTMVATEHQRRKLLERGFSNLVVWSRGVDVGLFQPDGRTRSLTPRPIFMYAGRIAVEKNLDAFLGMKLPGSKVLVGDGPERGKLRRRYPEAVFVGYKFGAELAAHLASADVFVFPSRTDTFGLVMLEAMACGTPVAAYPVTGPIDVVREGVTGILDEDLRAAACRALRLDRAACRRAVLRRSWTAATAQFLSHLVHAVSGDGPGRLAARIAVLHSGGARSPSHARPRCKTNAASHAVGRFRVGTALALRTPGRVGQTITPPPLASFASWPLLPPNLLLRPPPRGRRF